MKMLETMLITNNPEVAGYATESGVNRIFVDLEILGKEERQKNQNLLISRHSVTDIAKIKKKSAKSKVMVRINPPNPETTDEVNSALDNGADAIMLPYFTHPDEVAHFIKAVNGRATSMLLVETSTSMARIARILDLKPDEIHIGLNDLRLTFQLTNLFELISSGLLECVSEMCKDRNISFGIGGMGSITRGAEISPEMILKEYVRLGSERVILSRAFSNNINPNDPRDGQFDLKKELDLIQDRYKCFCLRPPAEVQKDRQQFTKLINKMTSKI
jgi:hypothetical protein